MEFNGSPDRCCIRFCSSSILTKLIASYFWSFRKSSSSWLQTPGVRSTHQCYCLQSKRAWVNSQVLSGPKIWRPNSIGCCIRVSIWTICETRSRLSWAINGFKLFYFGAEAKSGQALRRAAQEHKKNRTWRLISILTEFLRQSIHEAPEPRGLVGARTPSKAVHTRSLSTLELVVVQIYMCSSSKLPYLNELSGL